MSKPLTITLSHTLGTAEAKRRIEERLALLRKEYVDKIGHSEVVWIGDKANIKVSALGQQATAILEIFPELISIEIQLPWLLSALSNKIQGVLTTNAKESLKLTHTSAK